MMSKKQIGCAALATVLVMTCGFGMAQVASGTVETKPKVRQEIIKLKYIDNNEILSVLYTFLSREGRINPNPASGLITVSDYPENVDKILSVVREFDVKPADILFTIQLVFGSAAAEPKSNDVFRDDPVIRELKGLLSYRSFSLLDTSFIRAIDRQSSEVTMGKNADLRLELRPKYIKEERGDLIQVEARLNKKEAALKPVEPVQWTWTRVLESNFSLKPGEKTVVGVSKIDGGDKGLILIISGKIVS
jgi:hypothetical protein